MVVKSSKFVISAVSPKQYPEGDLLEIAFHYRNSLTQLKLNTEIIIK